MTKTGEAGNGGEKAVSDCRVTVRLDTGRSAPGVSVPVRDPAGLAEPELRALCEKICAFFSLSDVDCSLAYAGAPDWVVAARMEAALKQAEPHLSGEFLPAVAIPQPPPPKRIRFRRSRLYVPGDRPRFMKKAPEAGADGVIFDLEDAVAPERKDAARILTRNALRCLNLGSAEPMVRINPFPAGRDDLRAVIPQGVHVVLLPKCESAEQVQAAAEEIRGLRNKNTSGEGPFLVPIIESALGVERAFDIVSASPDVVAVTLGLEDYTADLGVRRSPKGTESLWARQRLVNAAAAAGVQALDSVYSRFKDAEGLRKSVQESRSLGYVGKGCIHPAQVPVVNEGFTPTDSDLEQARRVVRAFDEARAEGWGVVALDGKMIDPPVVKRALAILEQTGLHTTPNGS